MVALTMGIAGFIRAWTFRVWHGSDDSGGINASISITVWSAIVSSLFQWY